MAHFLYTCGGNWKTPFTAKAPEGAKTGDEFTIEELGFTQEEFFRDIVGYPYDEEYDHNIVELEELEFSDLPDGYWDIVEKHLSDYYSNDDVGHSNRLGGFVEGCLSADEEKEFIEEFLDPTRSKEKNYKAAKEEQQAIDVRLYNDALHEKANDGIIKSAFSNESIKDKMHAVNVKAAINPMIMEPEKPELESREKKALNNIVAFISKIMDEEDYRLSWDDIEEINHLANS